MNNEELLEVLSQKISKGEITREHILSRIDSTLQPHVKEASANIQVKKISHFSLTTLLYIFGASIVAIGVVIFTSQIWNDLGSFVRILITLGLGSAFAAAGSVLLKNKPQNSIGSVFHVLGGIFIPGGLYVTLYELNLIDIRAFAIAFIVASVFYALLNFVHKKLVLTFFTITNSTAAIYLTIQAIIDLSFYGSWTNDIYQYTIMTLGLSYLLLAHYFRNGWNKKLTGFLSSFGVIGFLGASFAQVDDSVFWQIVFYLFAIGSIVFSVYIKHQTMLVVSILFLIAHMTYITKEYFADSLGWPLSLILLGFACIGLGYASIRINKIYFSNNATDQ